MRHSRRAIAALLLASPRACDASCAAFQGCPEGYINAYPDDCNFWGCGSGCPGGSYVDTYCNCVCQCETGWFEETEEGRRAPCTPAPPSPPTPPPSPPSMPSPPSPPAFYYKNGTESGCSYTQIGEKCSGTYREFIVYDDDFVYPEFIVKYRRDFM